MAAILDLKMNKLPDVSISDYSYELPESKIAAYPLEQRDASKLLKFEGDQINDMIFSQLDEVLPAEAQLVFNETKVLYARMFFKLPNDRKIEVFALEPLEPNDIQLALQTQKQVEYKCLIGGARYWKSGVLELPIIINEQTIVLKAEKLENLNGSFRVRFSWDTPLPFAQILEQVGHIPLPPYLGRDDEEEDKNRYQTVYAQQQGSVAAPTAGLHFTEEVLHNLNKKGIDTQYLNLHVGAGTFLPVKSEKVSDHEMHREQMVVSKQVIKNLSSHSGIRVAVGTTSLRSLESLYWLGVSSMRNKSLQTTVDQWYPYLEPCGISFQEALEFLIEYMDQEQIEELKADTQIIIMPGYTLRSINALITNFHQPNSTLLLLIAACLGDAWRDVYNHALQHDYRFLSFGDSSILFKNHN